jgi:hypothetical protein
MGFAARAGPRSKAFGAFAHAGGGGSELAAVAEVLDQLSNILREAGEDDAATSADEIIDELQSDAPDRKLIRRSWQALQVGATAQGCAALVTQIEPVIHALVG